MVMDSSTGQLSGASVQIGAPIAQKKVSEALVAARDAGLYTAITDCGAGGLSSAVGEMAAELGADVDLARAPLKYPGLAPWEIWLSEAQERMVVAVPPAKMDELRAVCSGLDVELTDLGCFTGDGRLVVRYGGAVVIDLDCGFLHSGPPQRTLVASPPSGSRPAALRPALRAAEPAPSISEALLAILAHPAVRSRESTVRLYDHEVQGATVLDPYAGLRADGPQDDLPLDADVPEASREGDDQPRGSQQQRHPEGQDAQYLVLPAKRTIPHRPIRLGRAGIEQQQQSAGENERGANRHERPQLPEAAAVAGWGLNHACPPMRCPNSSAVVDCVSSTRDMTPPENTAIRSLCSMISSRSAEINRIAVPCSRRLYNSCHV